jgi:hypothetical protein
VVCEARRVTTAVFAVDTFVASEESMLRVEPSNLPNPRGAPRSRRLLPHPPAIRRRLDSLSEAPTAPRHEMVPPRDESAPPETELLLPPAERSKSARWSVRLELVDEDIAKLYGQGLTRGAVVWKKGMQEWRPLLITPELYGLLRRTRTTLTDLPATNASSTVHDEVTLPRPARVPSSILPPALANLPVTSTTVAPTAIDIEPSPKPRRPIELIAVAAAAFALAWVGRGHLHPRTDAAMTALPLAAASPISATKTAICEPATTSSSRSSSDIRTVSIADLPLVGAQSTAPVRDAAREKRSEHSASASGASPSRSELVAALSQVARAASGCGERGGPVRLVMSFAGSGVARSIQVSGADLPAPTRSCIIGAASRARVPAFSGSPITVSKTL